MIAHQQEEKPIRRGDRRWLGAALDSIEESGGIETRELAVQRWADRVWDTPFNTLEGADEVDKVRKLSAIANKLVDYSAQNAVKNVMRINDPEQVQKMIWLFDTDNSDGLSVDLINQAMDEKTIAKIASTQSRTSELAATRRLRRIRRQGIYKINLNLKLIGDRMGEYRLCTPFQQSDRNLQKASWRAFGEEVMMTCDDKEVPLIDVMRSASKGRPAEFIALSKGLDSYTSADGMTWAMVTPTCPPRMHANPANGNCTWDQTDPRQAADFLLYHWQKTEKILRKKHDIILPGYRPMEGQGDATPHGHFMIFAHPEDMAVIEEVFRAQVPEWASPQGINFRINDGRARASSYANKYAMKTMGGIDDLSGEVGANDVLRAAWGIRSFQWFGMPPIGLWRALRKMKEKPECEELRGIWHAVKRGDGHAYIGLAGGLNVKKKDRPFLVKKDGTIEVNRTQFIIRETGEVVTVLTKKWKWTRTAKKTTPADPVAKTATTPAELSAKINNEISMVGVILNYPSTSKPTPKPDLETDIEAELREVLGLDFRGQPPPHQRRPQNVHAFHCPHAGGRGWCARCTNNQTTAPRP